MQKKKEIWDRLTTFLQSQIPESEFKTWFSHTTLNKIGPEYAEIGVPNKFVASWLYENYVSQIQNFFTRNLNFSPQIRFSFGRPSNHRFINSLGYKLPQESIANLHHQLNPSLTFRSFITAKSNRFAYSSALEIAKKPAHEYNPLYIFSKLSFGKTHLLNAIANHIITNNPLVRVRYDSADQFSSDFSLAARNQNLTDFRQYYRNLDVFILDDIHILSGRKKLQAEITSLFNLFCESKKQIVVAGSVPPSQIPSLIPHLRSRMEGGLLTEIKAPDQKTKLKIIRKRSKDTNLHIPEDVAFFLANSANDLKTIIKYIVNLEIYSSLYQRKIDMSTVKSIINKNQSHKTSLIEIQKLTAEYFNISLSDILSNEKSRRFSYPRQVAMYLSRRLTNFSFKEIGKAFGNKDHSTVIYAVKRIEKDKDIRTEVFDDINRLQSFLL
jgi:chromosomal replication initiator protein